MNVDWASEVFLALFLSLSIPYTSMHLAVMYKLGLLTLSVHFISKETRNIFVREGIAFYGITNALYKFIMFPNKNIYKQYLLTKVHIHIDLHFLIRLYIFQNKLFDYFI